MNTWRAQDHTWTPMKSSSTRTACQKWTGLLISEKYQRITCLLAASVVWCISNALNLMYSHMVPNIVCCGFTLAWDNSSSSCTVWEEIITRRCIKNEHCRQKQKLAPKPHKWFLNVSTQNWGILLWTPSQWCTPTRPYHRLCDKIDFQIRGSPHAHCLLWVKDAPKLTKIQMPLFVLSLTNT